MLHGQFTIDVRMLEVIVLAAGRGTRMKSELPKVLHPIGGKPMVVHVLDTARQLGAERIHVVVGHGASQVSDAVAATDVEIYVQSEQLGTGHAALKAAPSCHGDSTVLILFGDVPLLSADVLADVVSAAETQPTLLAATLEDPMGYGRVIRSRDGSFARVVEQKDGLPHELEVKEVNTGVLAARGSELVRWLGHVKNDNAQGEFYLPDVLSLALQDGKKVSVVVTDKSNKISGVNDRIQLEALERTHQRQKADDLMAAGVHVLDASRLDIRGSLVCGTDVVLDANVLIEGEVRLGSHVVIETNCVLKDCVIGDGTVVRAFTHIEGAAVAAHCQVGPYARLRPGANLGDGAKVGNFVEVKNSTFGAGAKANHLAYVGDANVGSGSNIGAGTITCNYDGANKHRTELGENVFIGSNSTLVAPLTVEKDGFVAAGSTVTSKVGESQLAVGRAKQRNIDGWKRPEKPKR
ncbi:MAG: bifunctional UDP-N-acetylglucosamine diphosphorylase/glucosamine-1-phosphate N-acetyltransferase GlmU [Pseudomonadota bacterium]|nr:bifunctional UDP-N-acetylglucosamine diphosphorylase/glucosamine-1-phosphate N-acetyltransferase GlmU [Pseudomonadota bacterium]